MEHRLSLWIVEDTTEFAVSVGLHGLGVISDALVGRASWKNDGLDAFVNFWEMGFYDAWEESAAEGIWHFWLELVKKEKNAFGENSFFAKESSVARLEAMKLRVRNA
jgi:hypothetical protein